LDINYTDPQQDPHAKQHPAFYHRVTATILILYIKQEEENKVLFCISPNQTHEENQLFVHLIKRYESRQELLVLVPVLSQTLLTLMRRHFMSLTLLSAWHIINPFLKGETLT